MAVQLAALLPWLIKVLGTVGTASGGGTGVLGTLGTAGRAIGGVGGAIGGAVGNALPGGISEGARQGISSGVTGVVNNAIPQLGQAEQFMKMLGGGGGGTAARAVGPVAPKAGSVMDTVLPRTPAIPQRLPPGASGAPPVATPQTIPQMTPVPKGEPEGGRGWFTKLEDSMLGPEIAKQPLNESQPARWNARISALAGLSRAGLPGAVGGYGHAAGQYGEALERSEARDRREKFNQILQDRLGTEEDPNERMRLEMGQYTGSYSPPRKAAADSTSSQFDEPLGDGSYQRYLEKGGVRTPFGKPFRKGKTGDGGEKPLTPSQLRSINIQSDDFNAMLKWDPREIQKALDGKFDVMRMDGAIARSAMKRMLGEDEPAYRARIGRLQEAAAGGTTPNTPAAPVVTPENAGDVDSEIGAFLGDGGTSDPYKNAPSQNLESPLSFYDMLVSPTDKSPRSEERRAKIMREAIERRMREAEARRRGPATPFPRGSATY